MKDLPYRWLGEFVPQSERTRAMAWAQGLSAADLARARFDGYAVADWVQSSVVSYFRQYPPELSNPEVARVFRGFIAGAAIVATGLTRYLELHPIDAALLFNGRQSMTRVAFEVLRTLGIRVLTHEAPFYQRGHLMLKPNARCWSIEPFSQYWRAWRGIPLARADLERTLAWLKNRRYGSGLSWHAYNRPHTDNLSIRKELELSQGKRLLALFTSSMDETAGDAELAGPWETQGAWVEDVLRWVGGRSDVELVIRVHPHLAGKTGLGKAHDEFSLYQKMKTSLPRNVRLVMPDDPLNSYALMDEADVCLSFGSSVGIEMAMQGKPVVLAARAVYEDCAHVLAVRSRESLGQMLERSLQPAATRDIQREAFRLAFYYVFRFELPFPLVRMSGVMDADLRYDTVEALAPGKDDALDHVCDHLLKGQPLFDPPGENDRARSTADENAFFVEMERLREPFRDRGHETRLRRLGWLDSFRRSVVRGLEHLPRRLAAPLRTAGKAVYSPVQHWLRGRN